MRSTIQSLIKTGLVLAALVLALPASLAAQASADGKSFKLVHVSFDISREVVKALGDGFAAEWQAKNPGSSVSFEASHAGSSKQVQAILNGFVADLVTMNQFLDLQNLYDLSKDKAALIPANWASQLPKQSSPFASTMVFVVRSGNPKGIKDWADLAKPGLNIVAPNWKSTGNGRFSYLSAYAWAKSQAGASEASARAFVARILRNIPVFANGGRDATNLFDQRKQGDVLLTFEAEARQIEVHSPGEYQIITPSYGLRTKVYAATVQRHADARGTSAIAKAFWDFVYSPKGQEIAARNFFRPDDATVAARFKTTLPDLNLVEFETVYGDWEKVEREHFGSGGIYDQIFKSK